MHAVGAVTIKALCVIEGFSDYFEEYSHYFFFIINKVCLNSSGHFITCVVLLYGCFFHYLKIKKLKKPNKTHCCVGLSSTSARADFFFSKFANKNRDVFHFAIRLFIWQVCVTSITPCDWKPRVALVHR